MWKFVCTLGAVPLLALPSCGSLRAATPVRFSRDILPILSENCFPCHGPDDKARKAQLRLDTRAGALGKAKSGQPAILPGKAAASELIARVLSADDSEVMPPPKSKRKLTAEQKEVLRRWIDEGAAWGKHWAYETPVRPALPAVN